MSKRLCVLCGIALLAACTSVSAPTPTPLATVEKVFVSTSATPATMEEFLIRDVQENLTAYPRPQPLHNDDPYKLKDGFDQWEYYGQGLAAALNKLFSDTRSQSLSIQSLADIFEKGSGLSLAAYESPTGFVLVSLRNARPSGRAGGGDAPNWSTDTVYVLNRQGDIRSLGPVGGIIDAVWTEDHWGVLVADLIRGDSLFYAVWHVPQGSWQPKTELEFRHRHPWPDGRRTPQLGADGQTVTIYDCFRGSNPPCEDPPGIDPADIQNMAYTYAWQNGRYVLKEWQVIATITPSPQK
jgi:hypothetical protein